jgi:tRNA C32,U32 (ribose-2'-O)-methylase TrmJ
MMNMFHKRPGQIGFARRSMLQFGTNSSMMQAQQSGVPMHRSSMTMAAGAHRPIPFASRAQQLQQLQARRVSMEQARRSSLPSAFPNSAVAACDPVLMGEMMMRQRMAHSAAMFRRSAGV